MNQKLTLASLQPTSNLRPFFRLLFSVAQINWRQSRKIWKGLTELFGFRFTINPNIVFEWLLPSHKVKTKRVIFSGSSLISQNCETRALPLYDIFYRFYFLSLVAKIKDCLSESILLCPGPWQGSTGWNIWVLAGHTVPALTMPTQDKLFRSEREKTFLTAPACKQSRRHIYPVVSWWSRSHLADIITAIIYFSSEQSL